MPNNLFDLAMKIIKYIYHLMLIPIAMGAWWFITRATLVYFLRHALSLFTETRLGHTRALKYSDYTISLYFCLDSWNSYSCSCLCL